MSRELMVLLSLLSLGTLWVIVPMVPAILIYRLFPDTAVAVNGPLAALSVRASGAFAGYLVVFAAIYPLVQRIENTIGGFHRPFWLVTGQLELIDRDNKVVESETLLSNLKMQTNPEPFSSQGFYINMSIPEGDKGLPYIILDVQSFGRSVINLKSEPIKIDMFNKTIEFEKPITIKERPIAASYDTRPRK